MKEQDIYIENEVMPDLIIIDDDPFNNLLCNKIIMVSIPTASVKTFTDPREGLKHLLFTYAADNANKAVLFLDVNMPFLSGWEVLELLITDTDWIKAHVKIFMLSSSIDLHDKEKARNNLLVSDYLEKPLSKRKLQTLFPEHVI